jgi:MFS family permease
MKSRWWIVVASVLGLLVGNGPVMQFTIGTLLPSITREFGWTRGTVSSAMVAGLWMTGIATPLVGRLVDRFGIRAVALPAILVFFSCYRIGRVGACVSSGLHCAVRVDGARGQRADSVGLRQGDLGSL